LAPFLARQFLDRTEMLDIGRLDDMQQGEPAAGMRGTARRVMHRDLMLRGLVDDDQKDPELGIVGHRGEPRKGGQVPRNGRLASHPAITAATTAMTPNRAAWLVAKSNTAASTPTLETISGVVCPPTTSRLRIRNTSTR